MSHKILVIDESLNASELTQSILTQDFKDVDLLLAHREADAFERFHVAQPDLIILNESLPEMDAEVICSRLLSDPATARVPVIVLAANGNAETIEDRCDNVVHVLPKPVTREALLAVVSKMLSKVRPEAGSPRLRSRNPARIVFSGHTPFFSPQAALQMAYCDKLTGVLRFFINRAPIELFVRKGHFLFATTRNAQLYCKDSPVILSATNLGLVVEGQNTQAATGCPLFLFLSARNGLPHDDVMQIVRDHGLRVFANLWIAGRVAFEFEELARFPDYVRKFPADSEDPDNWALRSLRSIRYENLPAAQRLDPNGSPAYTRKGYDLVQHLKLNEVEARFATAINGAESLPSIAKKIGVPLNDALLLAFRFTTLEIVDYWSSNILSLPSAPPATGEITAAAS